MPSTKSKGDHRDVIRRFHAADDKARNERQKSMLLTYLAQLLGEASFSLFEQSCRLVDNSRRWIAKAAAARSSS